MKISNIKAVPEKFSIHSTALSYRIIMFTPGNSKQIIKLNGACKKFCVNSIKNTLP